MAGHSQFKNIMYRKGAQDAKRGKMFTKLIRELTTAARHGLPDPNANPRLRTAIQASRAANMSKDTMERAIKRGAGGEDDTNYEEMRYEGYAPGGVAVIVEALTDNRNRTASDIRSAFAQFGGNLGETNSVSFLFERKGVVGFPLAVASSEAMFEAALEAGADDVIPSEQGFEVRCNVHAFDRVSSALEQKGLKPDSAEIAYIPVTTVPVTDVAVAKTLLKLHDALEEQDDVQAIFSNEEMDEAVSAAASV